MSCVVCLSVCGPSPRESVRRYMMTWSMSAANTWFLRMVNMWLCTDVVAMTWLPHSGVGTGCCIFVTAVARFASWPARNCVLEETHRSVFCRQRGFDLCGDTHVRCCRECRYNGTRALLYVKLLLEACVACWVRLRKDVHRFHRSVRIYRCPAFPWCVRLAWSKHTVALLLNRNYVCRHSVDHNLLS